MLAGFHKYMVENGWKRTKKDAYDKNYVEDYESMHVSSYGPLNYVYSKDGYLCTWGLEESQLPPRWSFDFNRDTVGMSNEELMKFMEGSPVVESKWGKMYVDYGNRIKVGNEYLTYRQIKKQNTNA